MLRSSIKTLTGFYWKSNGVYSTLIRSDSKQILPGSLGPRRTAAQRRTLGSYMEGSYREARLSPLKPSAKQRLYLCSRKLSIATSQSLPWGPRSQELTLGAWRTSPSGGDGGLGGVPGRRSDRTADNRWSGLARSGWLAGQLASWLAGWLASCLAREPARVQHE